MSGLTEILLVTGISGAGASTALNTLEDLGWEVVDNLPLSLIDRLLEAPLPEASEGIARPIALGIGIRTRDFDAEKVIAQIERLRASGRYEVGVLFLECATRELERRYAETRRRHPLAIDRPVASGIVRERELVAALKDRATRVIDSSAMRANDLAHHVRAQFARGELGRTIVSILSFAFSRGVPPSADFVFDVRFLRNPHWVDALRPGTGQDAAVAEYISGDPACAPALDRIEGLLTLLLPRYNAEGKAYVTIAFGCTGGRHRSVYVAGEMGERLRAAGFSPTIAHRDLTAPPQDRIGTRPAGR